MTPTLAPGVVVFALSRFYTLKVGDIIIFRHAGLEKIKRITAISSETLTVNGDNLKYSTDSRSFGDILKQDILGKVVLPRRPAVPATRPPKPML